MLACALLTTACANAYDRETLPGRSLEPDPFNWSPVESPPGSTHVGPAKRVEEPRTLPATLVYDFSDLVDSVEELEASDADPHHARLIQTLRALADVLALSERPQTSAEIAAVRRAADELEDSPRDSSWHTDRTRYALEATLGVLMSLQLRNAEPFVEFRALVAKFSEQVDAIDQDEPLQSQHAKVAGALRTATEALLLAQDVTVEELRQEARRLRTMSPGES